MCEEKKQNKSTSSIGARSAENKQEQTSKKQAQRAKKSTEQTTNLDWRSRRREATQINP